MGHTAGCHDFFIHDPLEGGPTLCANTQPPSPRAAPGMGGFTVDRQRSMRIFVTWFLSVPRRVQPRERDQLEICVQNTHTHMRTYVFTYTHISTRVHSHTSIGLSQGLALCYYGGCICRSRVCRADRQEGSFRSRTELFGDA